MPPPPHPILQCNVAARKDKLSSNINRFLGKGLKIQQTK